MRKVFKKEELKEKGILKAGTQEPLDEVLIEEGKIVVKKGEEILEIPLGSVRGKVIYERLTGSVGEYTEPIYV